MSIDVLVDTSTPAADEMLGRQELLNLRESLQVCVQVCVLELRGKRGLRRVAAVFQVL